ncbi:hypothetical protein BgiMline_008847, partial [Biomphalaria glabrata]
NTSKQIESRSHCLVDIMNGFHGLTNSVPAIGAMMESLDLVISAGRGVLCPKSVTSSVNG